MKRSCLSMKIQRDGSFKVGKVKTARKTLHKVKTIKPIGKK